MYWDTEVREYLEEKQKKQDYLKFEIAQKGYDTVEFAQYLDSKKGMTSLITILICRPRHRDRQLEL